MDEKEAAKAIAEALDINEILSSITIQGERYDPDSGNGQSVRE